MCTNGGLLVVSAAGCPISRFEIWAFAMPANRFSHQVNLTDDPQTLYLSTPVFAEEETNASLDEDPASRADVFDHIPGSPLYSWLRWWTRNTELLEVLE
jgi:hypothetical protein